MSLDCAHAVIESTLGAALHLVDECGESIIIPTEQVSVVFENTGIPGPVGPGANRYEFTQPTPALTWTINHNFGEYPSSVRLLSVGGLQIEADIQDMSVNQVLVTFLTATAGTAILS